MFLLFLSTVLMIWICWKLLPALRIVEIISTGLLLNIGMLGLLPFFLREYADIPYQAGMLFITLFNALLLIAVLWLDRRKKDTTLKIRKTEPFKQSTLWFLAVTLALLLIKASVLPIQGWDAFSMYDARAYMMLRGQTFDELVDLSRYDVYNTNYYMSYPPMTSSIHALLYAAGFISPMFVYALYYVILAVSVLSMLKELKINTQLQFIGLGMLLFHPLLISQTSVAYTNLPMIALQSVSLMFLLYYIKRPAFIYLFLSAWFLSLGYWTRNEPTYLSFIWVMAVIIFQFHKTRFSMPKKIWLFVFYIFVTVILRVLWNVYLHQFVTLIPIEELDLSLSEKIVRLIESLFLVNLLSVVIFIYASIKKIWLFLFLAGAGSVFFVFSPEVRKKTNQVELGLLLLVFFNFLIIFGGTLYFSRVYSWWYLIGGSLLRSSLIFIPLCITYGLACVQHRLPKKK